MWHCIYKDDIKYDNMETEYTFVLFKCSIQKHSKGWGGGQDLKKSYPVTVQSCFIQPLICGNCCCMKSKSTALNNPSEHWSISITQGKAWYR